MAKAAGAEDVEYWAKRVAYWERKEQRQAELTEFVTEHNLACWKCKSRMNEWFSAKVGQYGPYATCVMCAPWKQRAA